MKLGVVPLGIGRSVNRSERQCYSPEEVQHADSACPFCIVVNVKKGTLSQHFLTHVVPPLVAAPMLQHLHTHSRVICRGQRSVQWIKKTTELTVC